MFGDTIMIGLLPVFYLNLKVDCSTLFKNTCHNYKVHYFILFWAVSSQL